MTFSFVDANALAPEVLFDSPNSGLMAAMRMPILQLGSTELTVSRLGLGLAALGRPAYINLGRQQDFGSDRSVAELERRSHQMLDAAYSVYPMTYLHFGDPV